jgi:hypothetical protein
MRQLRPKRDLRTCPYVSRNGTCNTRNQNSSNNRVSGEAPQNEIITANAYICPSAPREYAIEEINIQSNNYSNN